MPNPKTEESKQFDKDTADRLKALNRVVTRPAPKPKGGN